MNKKTKTFHEPIKDIPPLRKRSHLKLKLLIAFAVVLFLTLFFLLAKEYKETHTFHFQSPVIIQKPVIIKRLEIISPMSSKSASLGVAYAEEVKNPFDTRSPQGIAWELVKEKWGLQEWAAFDNLVTQESNWHPYSVNASSGSCGLPQALPCSKMGAELWDYQGQLTWMINYISGRYDTPSVAWEHEQSYNWY